MACCVCGRNVAGLPVMRDESTGLECCESCGRTLGGPRGFLAYVDSGQWKSRQAAEQSASGSVAGSTQSIADRPVGGDLTAERTADWYPDPNENHQYRYWDGASWSDYVADDGETSLDPFQGQDSSTLNTDRTASSDESASHAAARSQPKDPDSLEDLLPAVMQWMDSAPPVGNPADLNAFMDSIASAWHVSWTKGSRQDVFEWLQQCASKDAGARALDSRISVEWGRDKAGAPGFWTSAGVQGSVIEPCVCGYYHFIGKATDDEFLYLAHQ